MVDMAMPESNFLSLILGDRLRPNELGGTAPTIVSPLAPNLLAKVDSIPPEGRELLDIISGTESPGYDVLYGGEKFTDFSDHPRKRVRIKEGKNKGKFSSGAGNYQMIEDTWDRAAAATGVKDFSPESQDEGAWWLAQNDYKGATGRDLLSDLKSGDAEVKKEVLKTLSGTWEGLKTLDSASGGGASPAGSKLAATRHQAPTKEQVAKTEKMAAGQEKELEGNKSMLRMLLIKATLGNVRLQPVDYDPFAVMPKF